MHTRISLDTGHSGRRIHIFPCLPPRQGTKKVLKVVLPDVNFVAVLLTGYGKSLTYIHLYSPLIIKHYLSMSLNINTILIHYTDNTMYEIAMVRG